MVPERSPFTLLTSFRQMITEKQKAEEKEREAQQAAREETTVGRLGPEPSEDDTHSALEPEGWPAHEPPAESSHPKKEVPSPEKVLPPQKNTPEIHEKVSSSREKRESRRQRGLEHVELQNKHMQSCKDENALREPSGKVALEQEEHLPKDKKESREDEAPSDTGTEMEKSAQTKQPEGPPQTTPTCQVPRETPQAPQGRMERPTSLALDSRVGAPAPGTTPETSQEMRKPSGSPRAQDRPESPGGPTHIQRYRDPASERLANAVELWRGKNRTTTSPSTMLSQSLDLSERHRATGATLTPTE